MPKVLTNIFAELGWTRDDAKWLWIQILSVAGLITANVIDVAYWSGYLGVPLSAVAVHRVSVLATMLLWIGGRYGNSGLAGKDDPPAGRVTPRP